ncbi:MAG: hypothetical protein RLY93_18460 [Sumerlaeia bacterium]
MKYEFQAIDSRGTVRRGVLRAESEEEAREFLLGEELFPKTIGPADEECKVTWTPRQRIKRQLEAKSGGGEPARSQGKVLAEGAAALLRNGQRAVGTLTVTAERELAFTPRGQGEPVVLPAEKIEQASFRGFPFRWLVVTTLDGALYEFPAGFLLPGRVYRVAVRTLKEA